MENPVWDPAKSLRERYPNMKPAPTKFGPPEGCPPYMTLDELIAKMNKGDRDDD